MHSYERDSIEDSKTPEWPSKPCKSPEIGDPLKLTRLDKLIFAMFLMVMLLGVVAGFAIACLVGSFPR